MGYSSDEKVVWEKKEMAHLDDGIFFVSLFLKSGGGVDFQILAIVDSSYYPVFEIGYVSIRYSIQMKTASFYCSSFTEV